MLFQESNSKAPAFSAQAEIKLLTGYLKELQKGDFSAPMPQLRQPELQELAAGLQSFVKQQEKSLIELSMELN